MTQRVLSRYVCSVTAGPGDALVAVDIEYFDEDGLSLGTWTDNAMAFGYTWQDVARALLVGVQTLRLRTAALDDPTHPSPHVDLT